MQSSSNFANIAKRFIDTQQTASIINFYFSFISVLFLRTTRRSLQLRLDFWRFVSQSVNFIHFWALRCIAEFFNFRIDEQKSAVFSISMIWNVWLNSIHWSSSHRRSTTPNFKDQCYARPKLSKTKASIHRHTWRLTLYNYVEFRQFKLSEFKDSSVEEYSLCSA